VSVYEWGGEFVVAGEVDSVFGRGGGAFGEGDFVAVEFVFRGARAVGGFEWEDCGGV
jgi:hypothetical protein